MRLAYIVTLMTDNGLIERVLDQITARDGMSHAEIGALYDSAASALAGRRAEHPGHDVALICVQRNA